MVAITTGDLPPEARNLAVDHPRTSKFYMLPKIHKSGNPGRLIVSACNCPTSNISAYLDSVMAPLVKQLPTYVKDSSHALQILKSFSFTGSHRYLFTMDIKSLYTVIPNNDGLKALKYHLDLRPEQQPPTNTLVRLAELVLNLNCFDFDGNTTNKSGVWLWEPKWGQTIRVCSLVTSRAQHEILNLRIRNGSVIIA